MECFHHNRRLLHTESWPPPPMARSVLQVMGADINSHTFNENPDGPPAVPAAKTPSWLCSPSGQQQLKNILLIAEAARIGAIQAVSHTIKACASALRKQGFINYFGLQQFGSGSVPTHLIGASLLRGEWKSIVSMFRDPREGENNVITEAREYYKDVNGTLRKLPRHLVSERAILQCLKKCPGNYLQALKVIPKALRMMEYQRGMWVVE
ncbi:hypothetical protein C1H46_005167 [Malus baccata]|uniref:TRUD domain-containing protein n=1 Tax=Malus baccata TaxID=106549 RepID=A0A540NDX0_MALBA|nr:hypothetical protein C1H46_005167 [Malus baccata]